MRVFNIFFVFVCLPNVNGQFHASIDSVPEGLEQKALDYFCENKSTIHPAFENAKYLKKLNFYGETLNHYSSVFWVAATRMDINWYDTTIPKEILFADSLLKQHNPSKVTLNANKCIKKRRSDNGRNFLLVKRAIEYNNNYYVEIFINVRRHTQRIYLCIEFDKRESIIAHYLTWLDLDY